MWLYICSTPPCWKNASVGYDGRDYHPTYGFFLSVFKNSCVRDSPPLPLLLWPLILQSSWIPSREGKYSLHLPPELRVPLTLEQSLATKNRFRAPNFADSSCATTAFWHSVLLGGSHVLSLFPCQGWQKHNVSPKFWTWIPMTWKKKKGTWRFFLWRATEKKIHRITASWKLEMEN